MWLTPFLIGVFLVACSSVNGTRLFGVSIPLTDNLPDVPNPLNVIPQTKCLEDLGCFYTGRPFYDALYRPISFTPFDKEDLQTRFLLFNRGSPVNMSVQELQPTPESLNNSTFDPELETKFLIHGFRINLDENDIRFKIKDELLECGDYNVIIVDWTRCNGIPYAQAVANARAVAAQVAQLIQFLMSYRGITPQSVHLIGHSLGAQVSGWVGERVSNLGRITGLDPAGPYFRDAETLVRLDTTDALFVDVIHTDGGDTAIHGLGIGDPIGHMDFYPNGGNSQPGCSRTVQNDNVAGAFINATTDLIDIGCDHGRANDYFLESIKNSNCRFFAVECDSYASFENGACQPGNSRTAEMGFRAFRVEGQKNTKWFLRTNASEPFCIENGITV